MALGSFQLFTNQVQSSPPSLRVKLLQAVFDLLVLYDQEIFQHAPENVCDDPFLSPTLR
jgi:condensin complex subunit 3